MEPGYLRMDDEVRRFASVFIYLDCRGSSDGEVRSKVELAWKTTNMLHQVLSISIHDRDQLQVVEMNRSIFSSYDGMTTSDGCPTKDGHIYLEPRKHKGLQ